MVSGAGKGRRSSARLAEVGGRKRDMSSKYEDLWAIGNEDKVELGEEGQQRQSGSQANGSSIWLTGMQINGVPSASPMTIRNVDGLGQLKPISSSQFSVGTDITTPPKTYMDPNGVPSASPMSIRKLDSLGQLQPISSSQLSMGMEMNTQPTTYKDPNGVPSASPMTIRKGDGLGQLKPIVWPKLSGGREMTTQLASNKDGADHSNDPNKEKMDESLEKKKKPNSVSYFKLYSFASPFDWLLMLFGALGACAHGAAVPVFFIFFGRLIDSFGSNVNHPERMAIEVRKVPI